MADTVSVSFTGIAGIRGVDMSLARGVTPSVGIVYALPQSGVDVASGTLSISSGSTSVSINGCALAAAYIRKSVSKWPIMAFHVLDRRWKWRFSNVSGDYNRRLSDGTVDTATSKSPAELAGLLLSSLGEAGYDTSRMPTGVKPRALWNNQRADLALQQLCDACACEVVYNHQLDKFEIWPSGLGITLPTNSGEILPKQSYIPRAGVPSSVTVVGGPSVFQSKLKLSSILLNNGNSTEQLTANSVFKPSTGWDKESPFSLPGVTDSTNNRIAMERLWREYRVVGQQDGSIQPASCPTPVSSIDQYKLMDGLLDNETDLEGYKRNLPSYVDGDYYAWTDLPSNASSARYTGDFKTYPDRKVVKFPFPIFKLDSSGGFAEPSLYWTTTYQVVDNNNQLVALYQQGNIGGSGGTLIVHRPEVFATYSTSSNTASQASTELAAYVSLFQQKYASPYACEMEYSGISAITCDGNIAQVRWRALLGQPPLTHASEQIEHDTGAVPMRRRRLDNIIEKLAEAYL